MTIVRPDTDKVRALAALQVNNGNVKRTAAETGIPRSTIGRWRDQALADGNTDDLMPTSASWMEIREQAAGRFLETAERARLIVHANLGKIKNDDLSMIDIQRAAVVAGIAADKAKNLRRDGPEVVIDARHQQVNALANVSTEDLQALLASGSAGDEGEG